MRCLQMVTRIRELISAANRQARAYTLGRTEKCMTVSGCKASRVVMGFGRA